MGEDAASRKARKAARRERKAAKARKKARKAAKRKALTPSSSCCSSDGDDAIRDAMRKAASAAAESHAAALDAARERGRDAAREELPSTAHPPTGANGAWAERLADETFFETCEDATFGGAFSGWEEDEGGGGGGGGGGAGSPASQTDWFASIASQRREKAIRDAEAEAERIAQFEARREEVSMFFGVFSSYVLPEVKRTWHTAQT